MKRLIPLFIGILLIGVLALVNHSISKTAKPDNDDDDSQAQTTTKTSPPKTVPVPPAALGSGLMPELTLNDPTKAKYKVTVGWVYDEKTMADPQPLMQAIQVVQKLAQASGGTISAEIVDLDLPASEVSPNAASVTGLGVAVNGVSVGPSVIPGEDGLTADLLTKSLSAAMH
jgi:hypothetical protein